MGFPNFRRLERVKMSIYFTYYFLVGLTTVDMSKMYYGLTYCVTPKTQVFYTYKARDKKGIVLARREENES